MTVQAASSITIDGADREGQMDDASLNALPATTLPLSAPSSATTASFTTTRTTTTRDGSSTTTVTTTTTTTRIMRSPARRFVQTSGTAFYLDGSQFTVLVANAHWLGVAGLSKADINKTMSHIVASGATVVRVWGFKEVTDASGTYYQRWSGDTPTVNTGPDGLENFDNVVAAAKSHNLRLIVPLTDNWRGMDVYARQILGSADHTDFYTNHRVKAAFKKYVGTFVGRYAHEPTIMAWELANGCRCRGATDSSTCPPSTITTWVRELSGYVKYIDENHLVAVGDEGFYNQPHSDDYAYQGTEGVDFEANLAVPIIDFGTFQSFPSLWHQSGNELNWGVRWIADHASSQMNANKPVILEAFDVKMNQVEIYAAWWDEIISSGLAGGALIWNADPLNNPLPSEDAPDNQYPFYQGAIQKLMVSVAARFKALQA